MKRTILIFTMLFGCAVNTGEVEQDTRCQTCEDDDGDPASGGTLISPTSPVVSSIVDEIERRSFVVADCRTGVVRGTSQPVQQCCALFVTDGYIDGRFCCARLIYPSGPGPVTCTDGYVWNLAAP